MLLLSSPVLLDSSGMFAYWDILVIVSVIFWLCERRNFLSIMLSTVLLHIQLLLLVSIIVLFWTLELC